MTLLWLAVVVMLLLGLLLLVPPFLRHQDAHTDGGPQAVQAFYRSQLTELKQDVDNAALGNAEQREALDDITRGLLQDMETRKAQASRPSRQRLNFLTAGTLSVVLPIAAVLLYAQLGNPRAAADALLSAQRAEPHTESDQDMASAINALAQRMRQNPDDVEGWYMLARSYESMGRFEDAVVAYQNTLRLAPDEPLLLAD